MDMNPIKKLNLSNSPVALTDEPPIKIVDELNPEKKLITKLNHDCLAQVLMHLPVLERLEMEKVCQKWEESVGYSWYNVKKLDFDDLMITLDKRGETLEMIMRKCARYLTHLTIIGDEYPWMSSVLKENCQNIINFSININIVDGWKISNEDLVEIISLMPKLKYLRVEINEKQSRDLPNKIFKKLPEDIHEIHLLAAEEFEYEFNQITPVLEKFKGLHCLTLQGFELTNTTFEGILQNKNTLVELDLSRCEFPSNASLIFSNFKNLEKLKLDWVKDFNVSEIASIAHNCSKLKHFEFSNATEANAALEDVVPFNIYSELKYLNLEHLSIQDIDMSGYEGENLIAGLSSNWKQLKYLDIDAGCGFTTTDLEEITKLNNLEFVELDYAEGDSQLFINITINCPKLKELSMGGGNIIPEKTFLELPNLKKLEKLYCYYNNHLTGNFLSEIANNCENLVHLSISSCNNITEASLIQVGKLKNLKKLNIKEIKNVPNAMFYNFKKLKDLSCNNCPSVTDEGIIKVIDNCRKLSTLNLYKTGITVKSLIHASKRKMIYKILTIRIDKSLEYKGKLKIPNNLNISYGIAY